MKNQDYSTKKISKILINDISKSLKSINTHGSVEIYVQEGMVTQISVRNIKKTHTNGVSQEYKIGL